MSLILIKLSQCKISRSGSLQQLAPESGAIVSCRRSCPGHAADEDEEEEVDEEEEEDEEEEKEAMEKEPHLIQMRLALADISSDPAELCALPRMISLTAQGIAEAAKGSQNQDKIEEEGEEDDDDDEELAMLCAWFKTKYCKQR